jgi:hypothetical protein
MSSKILVTFHSLIADVEKLSPEQCHEVAARLMDNNLPAKPGWCTFGKQICQDGSSVLAGFWTELKAALYRGFEAILKVVTKMAQDTLISLIKMIFANFVGQVLKQHNA